MWMQARKIHPKYRCDFLPDSFVTSQIFDAPDLLSFLVAGTTWSISLGRCKYQVSYMEQEQCLIS
jgi:hypothetical protein